MTYDRLMPLFEKFVYVLVVCSVVLFFAETSIGGKDSLHGPAYFLWAERFIACVLTAELFVRFWYHSPHTKAGTNRGYFKSPEMFIDIIAVVPFWVGFVVPAEYLPAVRSLRILRLLKFYRVSPVAHLVVHRLIDQWLKIRFVMSFTSILVLFSGVLMHELEKAAQPDTFGSVFHSVWWAVVTLTTVGYGGMIPETITGKVVAMFLMLAGIGVAGALIQIVGAAFDVDPEEIHNAQSRKA